MNPQIYSLRVVDTTASSLSISALVNITNPTDYEASIPYLSLHILTNDTILANASVRDLKIGRGNNTALAATATWDPASLGGGGEAALRTGVEFLSQYISGLYTTVGVKFHEDSIPSDPVLSRVLARFNLTVPTPRLLPPGDGSGRPQRPDGEGSNFIDDARFHLLSSTADFVLRSPLAHTTVYVTDVDATALYRGSRVGRIQHHLPFAVEPVDDDGHGCQTPRLPVEWEAAGAGWDAVKRALGGRLKIAARAVVAVRIGDWTLRGIWYRGHGLGVGVGL